MRHGRGPGWSLPMIRIENRAAGRADLLLDMSSSLLQAGQWSMRGAANRQRFISGPAYQKHSFIHDAQVMAADRPRGHRRFPRKDRIDLIVHAPFGCLLLEWRIPARLLLKVTFKDRTNICDPTSARDCARRLGGAMDALLPWPGIAETVIRAPRAACQAAACALFE